MTNAPLKSVSAWMVVGPDGFELRTAAATRAESIEVFCDREMDMRASWRHYRRVDGYRCIRVTVLGYRERTS